MSEGCTQHAAQTCEQNMMCSHGTTHILYHAIILSTAAVNRMKDTCHILSIDPS